MFRLFFRLNFSFSRTPVSAWPLQDFSVQDYRTMCGLLRQKYQPCNEEVETNSQIKLLDSQGKVIGLYSASEARKKATGLGLDMVLVGGENPVICQAVDFRSSVLNRFHETVVSKEKEKALAKATATKSLKISSSLNNNELKLKVKQILQLARKNQRVRVYMTCRESNRDETLHRLEWLKSELQGSAYLEEDISNKRYEEEEDEEPETKDQKKGSQARQTYSLVIKARQQELARTILQQAELDAPSAVKNFLKNYYRQDNAEMMDLRSAGRFEELVGDLGLNLGQKVAEQKKKGKIAMKEQMDSDIRREAEARILNKRLKILLSLY